MPLEQPFSKRHQYGTPKEITVREGAPESLRFFVLETAKNLNWGPSSLRPNVCRVLRIPPDPGNWSEYPNVDLEVTRLMDECEWFKVYDIIEALHAAMSKQDNITRKTAPRYANTAATFAAELNGFFIEEGVGWQLVNGQIIARGDEGFQEAVKTADSQLNKNQRPTAASHIKFAVKALSERPAPNTSGAVAHATSAVECLLNDITGQEMTLGRYLDKHPSLFHPALKKALDGVYGYASDAGARHGKEGREPSFDEAQFAVTMCVAACTLLTAMNPKATARRS
jgi:hypothetical protein